MLSVSSLRLGIVTSAKKTGLGSASMTPSGDYSGTTDKEYIVQIDSIAGGAEVGQATFQWSNGGDAWNASGILTSTGGTLLEAGVYVKFASGTGADFAVGDIWYFKVINLFKAGAMIDLDRDHRYRSAALGTPNTITVDLGTAQQIAALIIQDHNLTSAATIAMCGNAANTWGAPAFSVAIPWANGSILYYLLSAQNYEFWQLQITDALNPAGYIEIGELYLGSYLELTKNFSVGFKRGVNMLYDQNKNKYGATRNRFYNLQRQFDYSFTALSGSTDVISLEQFLAAITSRDTGNLNPFWFNEDSSDTTKMWMVDIYALPENHHMRTFFDCPISLTERVASV
jgi:hypothetical protein